MKFKKLEIQGFKTFADKTELDFKPEAQVTCIVGPNGCGKSNLLDAIRWVMGEQSVKLLRGTNQEEVIFSGSSDRRAISLAEAELLIDNRERKLKIDYDEVAIKRRLFRSGDSEYYINKELVRLKDIQNLLLDTGLGKGSYAIIGQGQVDQILMAKPEDRRSIFEEAAGVNKYRTRKVVALRKLEKTDQNLLRLNDLRAEIQSQLGPLQIQSQKAEEYLGVKKSLGEIEIFIFQDQIKKINEQKSQIQIVWDTEKQNLTQLQAQLQNSDKTRQGLKEKIRALEQSSEALRGQLADKTRAIEAASSQIKISSERKQTHYELLLQKDEEIQLLRFQIENLKITLEEAQKELLLSQSQLEGLESNHFSREQEILVYMQKWQSLANELDAARQKYADTEKAFYQAEQEETRLSSQEEFLLQEQAQVRDRLTSNEASHQELLKALEENQKNSEKIQLEIQSQQTKQKEIKAQLQLSEAKQKELEQKRNELQTELHQKKSRFNVLQEMQNKLEGYEQGVRALIQNKASFPKLGGVLADLIQVPAEYERGLEMALGSLLQALLVPDLASARECLQYLGSQEKGRATLIPMEWIPDTPQKPFELELLVDKAQIRDTQWKRATDYFLSKIALAKSSEQAEQLTRKLASQHHIQYVLDPEFGVYSVFGAVSGGKNKQDQASVLSRLREIDTLEKECARLESDWKNLELDRQANQKLKDEQTLLLKQFEDKLHQSEKESIRVLQQIEQQNANLKKTEQEMDALKTKAAEQQSKWQDFENRKVELQKQKSELTAQKQTEQQNTAQLEQATKDSYSEKEKYNLEITELKMGLTQAKAEIRQNEIKIQNIQESLNEQTKLLHQKQQEHEKFTHRIQETDEQVEQLQLQLPLVLSEEKDIQALLQEAVAQKEQFQLEYEKSENLGTGLQESERSIRSKLSDYEIRTARLEAELSQIEVRLQTEYELTLDDALSQKLEMPPGQTAEQMDEQVQKLRTQLKRLGMVNPLSIDEYAAQKERLDFIEKQCADMESAKRDLMALIKELDGLAEKSYLDTFNKVKKEFETIFKELFEGGQAELEILDKDHPLDSGVDIFAQPTGKRRQNLMLLSGGEKSLTAIALLFALMKINPSPFYVLDEIDAALDEVNTTRFSRMLKKMANPDTHFLVITHSKRTMAAADIMYGVTMEKPGISKLISMELVNESAA